MRVIVQRVKSASVKTYDKNSEIKKGLLLYAGIEKNDNIDIVKFVVDKILNLRIFPNNEDKMDRSVLDINGEILSISQFTLASYIKKGRRPDFSNAKNPEEAEQLYRSFNNIMKEKIIVKEGVFGAMMEVKSINDGPVTFIIERSELLMEKKNGN